MGKGDARDAERRSTSYYCSPQPGLWVKRHSKKCATLQHASVRRGGSSGRLCLFLHIAQNESHFSVWVSHSCSVVVNWCWRSVPPISDTAFYLFRLICPKMQTALLRDLQMAPSLDQELETEWMLKVQSSLLWVALTKGLCKTCHSLTQLRTAPSQTSKLPS